MTTALITHPDCLHHATPSGHPERAARYDAITRALAQPNFAALSRHSARLAPDADILRCHPQSYLDRITAAEPATGFAQIDGDTYLSAGSLAAARRALGGCLMGVDLVMDGSVANAFSCGRPPGHHAERETPMGFCLFGNVSIAAKYALDHHGLSRVAIVDFDVHHGNGTQDLLWNEPRALYVSTHQMPLYPGSGSATERGAHNNILNIPLTGGSGGADMRGALSGQVAPAINAFKPELILISAGFDAHQDDPLADLNWTTEDFAWITDMLCDLARTHAGGRVVSTLEGGYDLDALSASVAAHVGVLMEQGS